MNFEAIVFYGLSTLLISLSALTVLARRVFHAALALTGALAVVGGLFVLLGADFLAAGQLLIYVGGIMIIMLFAVMFSQQSAGPRQTNEFVLPATLLSLVVAGLLAMSVVGSFSGITSETVIQPTTRVLGRLLLNQWLVPFEVVSLVLLAALVGAVHFSQKSDSQGDD